MENQLAYKEVYNFYRTLILGSDYPPLVYFENNKGLLTVKMGGMVFYGPWAFKDCKAASKNSFNYYKWFAYLNYAEAVWSNYRIRTETYAL
jgi:hypothetical protein